MGDPYRTPLFDIFPISLNDGLLDVKRSHARCNVALSMPTNAISTDSSLMTSHWDAETCDSSNYAPYVIVQGI